jgi:hypothetical protein
MARVIPELTVADAALTYTLSCLQARDSVEGVMLWLGRRRDTRCEVVEAYEPLYRSREDSFVIVPAGMNGLMDRIAATGLAVVAQIHTHPQRAFHSLADERWAIVRHVGAYSIVLPWFAQRTSSSSFWPDSAVFCMQADGCWLPLTAEEKELKCRTT